MRIIHILIVSTVLLITSCSGNKETIPTVAQQPISVTVAEPLGSAPDAVLGSGQIVSAQTANISTRVMGRITAIYAKAGDRVNKGQVLARVSDEDIRAKKAQTEAMIAEAEAAFSSAQKDLDRFNALYSQQSATAKELDNVSLQYNSMKSRLEAARQMRSEVNAMLSYSTLTAPFSGVVTQKFSEVGAIANPGMPIFTVEQNSVPEVSATVTEADISKINLGDPADVTIKSTGTRFRGKIVELNPSSQFTGGQYLIRISIPEAERKMAYSGMFVGVSIPLKEKANTDSSIVMIPSSALVNRDELSGVYTVSTDNTALLRWIRLGRKFGDNVEVISGLSRGEKYIASSESKLYNGAPVKLK